MPWVKTFVTVIATATFLSSSALAQDAIPTSCTLEDIEMCLAANPAMGVAVLEAEILNGNISGPARTLADHYADQRGDAREAVRYWKMSYSAGNPWAGRDYAIALIEGYGVEADAEAGLDVLRAVVDTDDATRKWLAATLASRLETHGDLVAQEEIDDLVLMSARAGNGWSAIRYLRENPTSHEAETLLRRAIETDGQFAPDGLRILSGALTQDGREEQLPEFLARIVSEDLPTAEIAKVELADLDARNGDLEPLELLSEEGNARASLYLGRHLSHGDDMDRSRAIELLVQSGEDDETIAPAAFHEAASILQEDGNVDRAIELYDLASTAGNSWSSFRLASLSRLADGPYASFARSEELARRTLEQGNAKAALPALMNLYGTRAAPDVEDIVAIVLSSDESAADIAEGLSWSSMNARVLLAQYSWREQGIYDGPIDGVMNSRTFAAFSKVCRENTVDACRLGIMPPQLMEVVVNQIRSSGNQF